MYCTPRILILAVALTTLMALSTSAAFAQDPDNGQVLWEETVWQCSSCHGQMGEGVWGRPLAGDTELTAADWINQVRNPRNRMPTFSPEQVSDDQIRDMQAYISSLPAPAEFGFKDAGLADDAPAGQVLLVEKRCVACHGTEGSIPSLTARNELPTAEVVIAQLRNPRDLMPSFRTDQVSDAEAAQIAEFLAAQFTPQALPESGGQAIPTTLSLMALPIVLGALMLAGGLLLRRRMIHS